MLACRRTFLFFIMSIEHGEREPRGKGVEIKFDHCSLEFLMLEIARMVTP